MLRLGSVCRHPDRLVDALFGGRLEQANGGWKRGNGHESG